MQKHKMLKKKEGDFIDFVNQSGHWGTPPK